MLNDETPIEGADCIRDICEKIPEAPESILKPEKLQKEGKGRDDLTFASLRAPEKREEYSEEKERGKRGRLRKALIWF